MLKEFKEKEFERLSNLIDSYVNDISELTKQIGDVAEKYRKLAEEETKNLTEAVEYYTEQLNNFYLRRDELKLEMPEEKPEEANPVEEEKVVDTLYPENNADAKEPVTTQDTNETDGTITEEDVIVEEPEQSNDNKEESVEEWPAEEEHQDPNDSEDDSNDWPEFPEEWK